jgi:nanoRNase/pAp phosphatase (c-di-AMP/oligoRNAs hydrolase)
MNSDRGVVTAFVLGLVLAFVLLAGLAVDSGRLVAAHVTAGDHAENAARAGAQEVTLVRLGWRLVDPRRATATARAYLDAHGLDGDVTADFRGVTVTVRVRQATTLLRLVGIEEREVSSTRTARLVSS